MIIQLSVQYRDITKSAGAGEIEILEIVRVCVGVSIHNDPVCGMNYRHEPYV